MILREDTLFESVHNNNIKYLIAYYSTALLEALYDIYPIMIINNNFHLKDYLKEKTVFKLQKLERFKFLKIN